MRPCAVHPQSSSAGAGTRVRSGEMKETYPEHSAEVCSREAIHRLWCALDTRLEAAVPFPRP